MTMTAQQLCQLVQACIKHIGLGFLLCRRLECSNPLAIASIGIQLQQREEL